MALKSHWPMGNSFVFVSGQWKIVLLSLAGRGRGPPGLDFDGFKKPLAKGKSFCFCEWPMENSFVFMGHVGEAPPPRDPQTDGLTSGALPPKGAPN